MEKPSGITLATKRVSYASLYTIKLHKLLEYIALYRTALSSPKADGMPRDRDQGPEKGFTKTHGLVSNSTVMSLLHYDSILECNPLASGTEGPLSWTQLPRHSD
jgi:hypothetical protein